MIADLKPYPVVGDSGVSWLGELPDAWATYRLKRLAANKPFAIVDGPFGTQLKASEYTSAGVPLIRVKNLSYDGHFLARGMTFISAEKWAELKRSAVESGDVVVAKTGATIGKTAVLPAQMDRAMIASSCIKFSPNRNRIGTGFAKYLMTSAGFQGEIMLAAGGSTRDTINLGPFENIEVPLPPLREQAAITRFLDHADGRIARYIAAKKKLIALLNEQRHALVHRAVTRGIDPDAALRPSGINWIGDVPEHWVVSRVKNEFKCLNSIRVPLSATERGAMTARAYDYYGASGVIDRVDEYLFDGELLLIAEDGANLVLRNLPLVVIARGKFWVNNHAHILKPRRGNLEFLAHLLESYRYDPWISGAAQPKLTQDRLMSVAMAVPERAEQERIVDWIAAETEPLSTGISQARRGVELLREWRVRLVSDVVTGKLDVREAAARLSDEAEEPETLEGEDALAEGDESGDEADLDGAADEAEA